MKKRHYSFDFDKCLKEYLSFSSEGEIVDAELLSNESLVSPADIVQYVIKHLEKSFKNIDSFGKIRILLGKYL